MVCTFLLAKPQKELIQINPTKRLCLITNFIYDWNTHISLQQVDKAIIHVLSILNRLIAD